MKKIRQEDKPYCNSIEGYLNYIYKHDKYKVVIKRGETVNRFSSKKYARRDDFGYFIFVVLSYEQKAQFVGMNLVSLCFFVTRY